VKTTSRAAIEDHGKPQSLSPQITDNKFFTKIMARARAFGIGRAFFAIE